MIDINKIYKGTCLDVLKTFPDNSIDSCVTDPPYGISFMNKHWDYDVPKVEVWKEVLRVLKPGGHILCACGTRTQHRMAVNIEDAGFEIRDVITWHYGCLSDDTEVLTETGWKLIGDILNKKIAIYDKEQDAFRWEFPDKWNVYQIADTCYRIKSDFTDQLVSRNHRCLIERNGELIFQFAESLQKTENVPYLEDMPTMQPCISYSEKPQNKEHLLFKRMQRSSKGQGVGLNRMEGFIGANTGKEKGLGITGRKKSSMEGRYHLQEQEGVLQSCENKVCEMPNGFYQHEPEGRVCNGIQVGNGSTNKEGIDENGMCSPYRPQPNEQRYNESDVIQEQCRTQKVRMGTRYNTTLATITPVEYSGIVFCPTVSTGVFVARRNGKIFITGNSGFPKSLDISKAIDKQAGVEREVVGEKVRGDVQAAKANGVTMAAADANKNNSAIFGYGVEKLTIPSTDEAKEWEGWGTALKPATEFWTLARKPLSEKTVAENVLKYGTGGINIDGSRIETTDELETGRNGRNDFSTFSASALKNEPKEINNKGRFPANVIFDEFMGAELDKQTGVLTSGHMDTVSQGKNYGIYGKYNGKEVYAEGDSGGASRFFYCPKADNYERNKGLKRFDGKQTNDGREKDIDNAFQRGTSVRQNHHPTVKPIDLMRYLVKLITPKRGICLDPYCGSGTTLIGCKMELINYIGIEREEEYCKIAEARVAAWNPERFIEQKLF
jgi:DNA modification methylase